MRIEIGSAVRGIGGIVLLAAGILGLPSIGDDLAKWPPALAAAVDFLSEPIGRLALVVAGAAAFWWGVRSYVNSRVAPHPVPTHPHSPAATPASETLAGVVPSAPATLVPFAQPQDREFVPPSVTPQYLSEFFTGHTDAEGKRSVSDYFGKWISLHEPVSTVQVFETSAVVGTYLKVESLLLPFNISLWFSKEWRERVGLLREGDEILAVGRITGVSKYELELRDCELVGR